MLGKEYILAVGIFIGIAIGIQIGRLLMRRPIKVAKQQLERLAAAGKASTVMAGAQATIDGADRFLEMARHLLTSVKGWRDSMSLAAVGRFLDASRLVAANEVLEDKLKKNIVTSILVLADRDRGPEGTHPDAAAIRQEFSKLLD